jgi:hypothetical protein
MKEILLTMLEADEGMVLTDGINYCSSVLLRKGQTAEGWSEITQEEYDELFPQEVEDVGADT